jgi:hypothetical protein
VTRRSQISKNLFVTLLLLAAAPGVSECELGCTLLCEEGEGDRIQQDSVSFLSDPLPFSGG